MLQQEKPDDFVIATGVQHSVREFVDIAARELGIWLRWEGSGVDEKGIVEAVEPIGNIYRRAGGDSSRGDETTLQSGDVIVRVDPRYFRPVEVETLLGDPTKARNELGWKPSISFEEMVREMVRFDLEEAQRDSLCKQEGFTVFDFYE